MPLETGRISNKNSNPLEATTSSDRWVKFGELFWDVASKTVLYSSWKKSKRINNVNEIPTNQNL